MLSLDTINAIHQTKQNNGSVGKQQRKVEFDGGIYEDR